MKVTVTKGSSTMSLETSGKERVPLQDLLCALEQAILEHVYEECGKVKARTGDFLMLKRTTVVEKFRKYGMALKKRGSGK